MIRVINRTKLAILLFLSVISLVGVCGIRFFSYSQVPQVALDTGKMFDGYMALSLPIMAGLTALFSVACFVKPWLRHAGVFTAVVTANTLAGVLVVLGVLGPHFDWASCVLALTVFENLLLCIPLAIRRARLIATGKQLLK